ncbi:hypothetical protein IDH44_25520 [Paenibacillus sp. IB182496]|uniref:Uncharacterized protein n=1 Tax=Paenibacillus sabuli TaxID=2772509 RepID=A0A927GVA7_9BACL|nr:hypothetical protein [Paenibacillus sabuli]MBD2848552.1 hypothetical protein [Paenibacillus sabuli]
MLERIGWGDGGLVERGGWGGGGLVERGGWGRKTVAIGAATDGAAGTWRLGRWRTGLLERGGWGRKTVAIDAFAGCHPIS